MWQRSDQANCLLPGKRRVFHRDQQLARTSNRLEGAENKYDGRATNLVRIFLMIRLFVKSVSTCKDVRTEDQI
jgi:hypothetical protein